MAPLQLLHSGRVAPPAAVLRASVSYVDADTGMHMRVCAHGHACAYTYAEALVYKDADAETQTCRDIGTQGHRDTCTDTDTDSHRKN